MKYAFPMLFYGTMLFGSQIAACLYLVILGDLSVGGLFTAILESLPR
jgi:hypothetical protein